MRCILLRDVLLCDVLLCDVLLCDVLLCDVLLCDVLLCDVLLCDVLLCDVLLCDVLLCDVLLCDVLLCDVLLFDVLLFDVLLLLFPVIRNSEDCFPTSFDKFIAWPYGWFIVHRVQSLHILIEASFQWNNFIVCMCLLGTKQKFFGGMFDVPVAESVGSKHFGIFFNILRLQNNRNSWTCHVFSRIKTRFQKQVTQNMDLPDAKS